MGDACKVATAGVGHWGERLFQMDLPASQVGRLPVNLSKASLGPFRSLKIFRIRFIG
jgi:hypothetical protein